MAQDVNSGSGTSGTTCSPSLTGDDKEIYNQFVPFNLSPIAVVKGIQVQVVGLETGALQPNFCITLCSGGTVPAACAGASQIRTAAFATTSATYLLGSTSDLWGWPTTPDNLNATGTTGFRVRIEDTGQNGCSCITFKLDYIAVQVTVQ